MELKGLIPSTILPLNENRSVAGRNFTVHVQGMARVGRIGGVIVNDHVGEFSGLSREERAHVVGVARKAAPKGFPVIAGVGAESTDDVIAQADAAREQGADAVLVLEGSGDPVEFHRTVASATGMPLLAQQGATRGANDHDALVEVCGLDGVIGVKTTSGDASAHTQLYDAVGGRCAVVIGAEGASLPEVLAGAKVDAVNLVAANVVSAQWARFVEDALNGRAAAAKQWYGATGAPLTQALLAADERGLTRSAPLLKEALVQLGLLTTSRVRPPGTDLGDDERKAVSEALGKAGLAG